MKKISLIVMFLMLGMFGASIAKAYDGDDTKSGVVFSSGATGGISFGNTTSPIRPPQPGIQIGSSAEAVLSVQGKIENRFPKALARVMFEKDRLENVIARLAPNFDMTKAKTALAAAQVKIDLAKKAVKALEDYVKIVKNADIATELADDHSSISAMSAAKIRDLATKARIAIQVAHKANMDVLHAITASFGLGMDEDNNGVKGNDNDNAGNNNNQSGPSTVGVAHSGSVTFSNPNSSDTACGTNTTPSIKVLSPNGGEVFTAGQQITVKWKSCNIPNTRPIFINLDVNNTSYDLVDATQGVLNNGSKTITLPTQSTWQSMQFGQIYKISLGVGPFGNLNGSTADNSDNSFTIKSILNVDGTE